LLVIAISIVIGGAREAYGNKQKKEGFEIFHDDSAFRVKLIFTIASQHPAAIQTTFVCKGKYLGLSCGCDTHLLAVHGVLGLFGDTHEHDFHGIARSKVQLVKKGIVVSYIRTLKTVAATAQHNKAAHQKSGF